MMNIKFMFVVFAIIIMAISSSASAYIGTPFPINGRVEGINVGNLDVRITNLRTGKYMDTTTSNAGEFLVDWYNSDDEDGTIPKNIPGDGFEIRILSCDDLEECVKHVLYSIIEENAKNGIPSVIFDLTSVVLPCPTTPTCETCETCEECEECIDKECPTNIWDLGIGAVMGLVIALVSFMGGGIKVYKNRLGKAVFLHRHRGIKEYHNPNTRHMNLAYRHRRWGDDPLGCVSDVAKIESEGGLI
jgi:hypothetical protein